MRVVTLASGSSGNCLLVSDRDTHVLVDAGISAKRIREGLAALGIGPEALSGVFITHTHSDHIGGLAVLTRRHDVPVYASEAAGRELSYRIAVAHCLHTFAAGESFSVGGLTVQTVPTSHDAPGSAGYAFVDESGRRFAMVTDLGEVTEAVERHVRGANVLLVETNHDPELLRNGGYPIYIKQRISGEQGHLSNADGAALAALAAADGAHTLVLAHLSQDNNTPTLALAAVETALRERGTSCACLEVAPRHGLGRVYEV